MNRRRLLMTAGVDTLTSGLIFHAPLLNDLTDRISGLIMTVAHGYVTPAAGGAIFEDGRLALQGIELPIGSDPCTLAIRVAPSAWGVGGAGTGYCDFFGYGQPQEGQARLIAANLEQLCGHLYARDYDADFRWRVNSVYWVHCAVTISAEGVAVYANGVLLGVSDIVPETTPGELTIGGCFYDVSQAYMSGLVKDARVYNRVLTSEEIELLAKSE